MAQATARAERKARRLTLGLTAAVGLLLAGGGLGAWWLQQQRAASAADRARKLSEANLAVRAAVSEGRRLLDQAKEQPLADGSRFRDVDGALKRAEDLMRATETSSDVRWEVQELQRAALAELAAAARDRDLLAALGDASVRRVGKKTGRPK